MSFKNGMVSSIHPLASKAGIEVLKKGGNAIDAAVATSAIMGVVAPQYSGLGGGGFILIHSSQTDETIAIDCREVAPLRSDAQLFKKIEGMESQHSLGAGEVAENANRLGYKAIGIPGNLAGLSLALDKYGTMTFKELLGQAINLADKGFPVSRRLAEIFRDNIDDAFIKAKRFSSTSKIYLKDENIYTVNEKIVNKDLARSLNKIAEQGPSVFYTGEIAQIITDEMEKHGGLITKEDLQNYCPIIREPCKGTYKEYQIFTMPPPGGGATIIEILNILEEFNLKKLGHNTLESLHIISEAMMQGFTDKGKYITDPEFNKLPYEQLLSKKYAKGKAKNIKFEMSSSILNTINTPSDKGETVHFSVIDKNLNVVAMTESIECFFGSGVVIENTGILMNDQMHDFDPKPGSSNSIVPGKRPPSSMSPTIILKDDKPFLALGGAGGPRIISSSIAVITNIIDYEMKVKDALSVPRIHAMNGEISIDPSLPGDKQKPLEKLGHKVTIKNVSGDEWWYFGAIQAIMFNNRTGDIYGAADPRRDGEAIGY